MTVADLRVGADAAEIPFAVPAVASAEAEAEDSDEPGPIGAIVAAVAAAPAAVGIFWAVRARRRG